MRSDDADFSAFAARLRTSIVADDGSSSGITTWVSKHYTASDYRAIRASLRAKWPESPETVTASCVPRAEGL